MSETDKIVNLGEVSLGVDRHSPVIAAMAQARGKPRGVDRTVLVDRETRLSNDRRWAEWDREDRMLQAAAHASTPQRGWLRRLFGF